MRMGIAALALAAFGLGFGAQEVRELVETYETSITVFGERLPLHDREILEAESPVSVVTRGEIEASGATTVQEALERVAGVTFHDQTGNPTEATLDLRGFPQGTSAAVFLDGVRLNRLEDNAVALDALPLEEVERIEVYRGAAAPLFGGGALAGVVNVVTRRDGGIPRLDASLAAGSFGSREGRLHAHGTAGPADFYATALKRRSDGYRENDGEDLDDALVRIGLRPGEGHEVGLLLKYHGGEVRQPGALTAEEMEADRRQSPFNLPDATRGRHRLGAVTYAFSGGEGFHLSAQAYGRLEDRDTLTTGRWGIGFASRYEEALSGVTFEVYGRASKGPWKLSYGAGGEWASGHLDARGAYTDALGANPFPASSTKTAVRPAGLFVQASAGRGPWQVSGGYRRDATEYRYRDFFAPGNDTDRTFREGAGRLSLLLRPTAESALYLTYAEGYRIPSVIDLFAYPGFYSNPDLRPTRTEDWEFGYRLLRGRVRLQVDAFRMRVRDEVVFVLVDPALFIGQNRNAGSSRRDGLEAEGSFDLGGGFSLRGSATYLDAAITGGPYEGIRVPMVPRGTASASLRWADSSWTADLAGLWVGSQPLDNDLGGSRPELQGHFTLDASVRWIRGGLTVAASISNLLDRKYASRGITNGFEDYYTPARPLSARLQVTWSF